MKVTCNHCGAQNDLGRMFCMACGKRMTISREDVDEAKEAQQAFRLASLLKPLILLAILALILSAIWPLAPFEIALPASGQALAGARVAARVNGLLAAARARKTVKGSFTADDLMLYLKSRQNRAGQSTPISVSIAGNGLTVRQQAFLGPFQAGGKRIGPFRFTREVRVEPRGRIVVPRRGRFGHLPIPGPLVKLVSGPVAREFMLNSVEQTIEKQITQMSIQDGKLEIVLGP